MTLFPASLTWTGATESASIRSVGGVIIMAVVCPECDNPIVVNVDEVEEGVESGESMLVAVRAGVSRHALYSNAAG